MKLIAVSLAAVCWFIGIVHAQDLPKTEIKVLGGMSTRSIYKNIEQPFWSKTVRDDSMGQITADIKGFDEVGIKGGDLLKLTGQGVAQFATIPLSYYTLDQPINEAVDLAGITTDVKLAKQINVAFLPVFEKIYRGSYGLKTFGVVASAPQLLFCRSAIKTITQLKGRTVRTTSRSQAELVQALGGKAKVLPIADTARALKDKSIDCAIGTSMVGFQSGWYEGANYVFTLALGWNEEVHVVNQAAWDALDGPVRTFLEQEIKKLLGDIWNFAIEENNRGLACLTQGKDCPAVSHAKMTLVVPQPSDYKLVRSLAKQKVLPRWAKRCNAACVNDFNATIGKALNLNIKQ